MVPLDGRAHRLDELLAPGPLPGLPGRRVRELHPGLGREVLDGADEVDVLVLLDEREHVARLVAAEALVAPGLLADVERRRLLGVERAQPDPVAPDLAQRDELADDVDDRHRRAQPLDVVVGDRHRRRGYGRRRDLTAAGVRTLTRPRSDVAGVRPLTRCQASIAAPTMAWAAARRAIGTRNGEQLT